MTGCLRRIGIRTLLLGITAGGLDAATVGKWVKEPSKRIPVLFETDVV